MDDPLTSAESVALANMLMALRTPCTISATYTNWRGETRKRHLTPRKLWHGSTEWHPEPGLMLTATDLQTGETRDFRMADFDATSFVYE